MPTKISKLGALARIVVTDDMDYIKAVNYVHIIKSKRSLTAESVAPKVLDRLDAWGEAITKRRCQMRLSQSELAGLVGVTHQTIGRLEQATLPFGSQPITRRSKCWYCLVC